MPLTIANVEFQMKKKLDFSILVYRYIEEPFFKICNLFCELLILSLSAAPLYLVYQGVYWLAHGEFKEYSVCRDAGLLCPGGKALGVDKILWWFSERPFAFICMCCVGIFALWIFLTWILAEPIDNSRLRGKSIDERLYKSQRDKLGYTTDGTE